VTVPAFTDASDGTVPSIAPQALWDRLRDGAPPPVVIDVREPREFKTGHISDAQSLPLPTLLAEPPDLLADRTVVLVCRGGRRSTRAAHTLRSRGYDNVMVLEGGMLAWEAADLLEAVDTPPASTDQKTTPR
jgi:SulP family sulfate permease